MELRKIYKLTNFRVVLICCNYYFQVNSQKRKQRDQIRVQSMKFQIKEDDKFSQLVIIIFLNYNCSFFVLNVQQNFELNISLFLMLEDPPLVYIYNLPQDIIDTFRTLSQEDRAKVQFSEYTWYNEKQLLGILSESPNRQSYHFIFMKQIDQYFIQYACDLLFIDRNKIEISVPNKLGKTNLGSICQYMLSDEQLMNKLKNLPRFDLMPYCMSEQFQLVYDTLKSKANPIEYTTRQNWQNIKRLGTKSGLRELVSKMKDPKIFMPQGRIFYKSQTSYEEAVSFIVNKLKNQNIVVKTDKFYGGYGVALIKKKQVQGFDDIQLECFIREKMSKPYWRYFDIVVEQYIQTDPTIGPPYIQLHIDKQGHIQFVWLCSMVILNGSQCQGLEYGKQLFRKDIYDKMVYIGQTLGQIYSNLGYWGKIAIDFLIDKKGVVYLGESNVRRCGYIFIHNFATYIHGKDYVKKYYLMTHQVVSEKVVNLTPASFLEEITQHGFEYTHFKGTGVVLSSCELFKYSMIEFFTITNTRNEALRIGEKIKQIYE